LKILEVRECRLIYTNTHFASSSPRGV